LTTSTCKCGTELPDSGVVGSGGPIPIDTGAVLLVTGSGADACAEFRSTNVVTHGHNGIPQMRALEEACSALPRLWEVLLEAARREVA
jgi:hypothetical protein